MQPLKPYRPSSPYSMPLTKRLTLRKESVGSPELAVKDFPEGTTHLTLDARQWPDGSFEAMEVHYQREVPLDDKEMKVAQDVNKRNDDLYQQRLVKYEQDLREYEARMMELKEQEQMETYRKLKEKYER